MVLLAQGCARSRNAASAGGDAQSDAAAQPGAASTPAEMSAPPAASAPPDQRPAGEQPTDRQPAAAGSSRFLAHLPRRPLLPEDAMIGPLADQSAAAAGDRVALQTAGRLLAAVRSGDLTGAPLSPEAAESIGYHLRRGVTLSAFRLGAVERTGDSAFLRARLSGPFGSIPAEIYLILDADRWIVDDVQADWNVALDRAQSAPEPEPIPLPRAQGWTWF